MTSSRPVLSQDGVVGQVSVYHGQSMSLLTCHGKEIVIEPVLQHALGCHVKLTRAFDTNGFGSFSRSIERTGTQLEAARAKARKGMELTDLPLGLASEGAFGPDPVAGFVGWNIEIVILIDAIRDIEIIGRAMGYGRFQHCQTDDWHEAVRFAQRAGFPSHSLVVRPDHAQHPDYVEGLADWVLFEQAFRNCQRQSSSGIVLIENDARAEHNPTRMRMIEKAAENLAQAIQSSCPVCNSPGFWIHGYRKGRPCRICLSETEETRAEIWLCPSCAHTEERESSLLGDPANCPVCNP